MSTFVQEACNERTGRHAGWLMQVHEGGAIHVMHYSDRTMCGMLEEWMGGYRTFDEDNVNFSEHQMPTSGTPCKSCFSAMAAEARKVYKNS